jgi:hypothetical protein
MNKWLIRLCLFLLLLGSAACSDKKKEPVTNPDPSLKPQKAPEAEKIPPPPKGAPRR